MPAQKKFFAVDNLTAQIKDAKAVILTDYRGLNVAQMQALRRAIQNAGGKLEVTKNTLLKIAFQNTQIKDSEIDAALVGPTATLFAEKDELSSLKALVNFAKEHGLPKLKIGFINSQILLQDKLEELALLPSHAELILKLLGLLSQPKFGLINALSWNQTKLVLTLKALKNSKGGES
jgi:large subunit ribosomal protein L10